MKKKKQSSNDLFFWGSIAGLTLLGLKLYADEKEERESKSDLEKKDYLEKLIQLTQTKNFQILEDAVFQMGSKIVQQAEKYVLGYLSNGVLKDYAWSNKNDRENGNMDCNGFVSFVMQDLKLEPQGTFLGPPGFPYSKRYKRITSPSQNGDILVMVGYNSEKKYVGGHVGIFTKLDNSKSIDLFKKRMLLSGNDKLKFTNKQNELIVPETVMIEMNGGGQGYSPVSYFRKNYYIYPTSYNGATSSDLYIFRRKIDKSYFIRKYEWLYNLNIINDINNQAERYWLAFSLKYPDDVYEG